MSIKSQNDDEKKQKEFDTRFDKWIETQKQQNPNVHFKKEIVEGMRNTIFMTGNIGFETAAQLLYDQNKLLQPIRDLEKKEMREFESRVLLLVRMSNAKSRFSEVKSRISAAVSQRKKPNTSSRGGKKTNNRKKTIKKRKCV